MTRLLLAAVALGSCRGSTFRDLASPFRDGESRVLPGSPEFLRLLDAVDALDLRVVPDLTADRAYREPARHRGDVVRCRGRLIKVYTEPFPPESGRAGFLYLAILEEQETRRTVYVHFLRLPGAPLRTYQKAGIEFYADRVEVDGVFVRGYDYPSQYDEPGGKPVVARAAVLAAKTLRVLP